MNHIFYKLANDAWIDAPDGGGYDGKIFSKERFAELIVRECAQRCEDIGIKHQVEETTYAAGKKAGAFECAVDLKQHFGVEL